MAEDRLHLGDTFQPGFRAGQHLAQLGEFLVIVTAQFENRLKTIDSLLLQSALQQFGLDVVQTDLFQFVDGHRDVHHLVGMTDRLGDSEQDLAVVHLQCHADSQRPEDALDNLHQFDLAQQRARADHVDVTLIEFAVTALLGTVGSPDGLDLIAFEGEGQLALMLHDIAGKGDRQVVTQPLFADFRGLTHLVVRKSGGIVARIEDLEEQFVTLVAVFTQQRR